MVDKKDKKTEDKIKDAAKKLFLKKGYAGTKIREIAEEAGINLALMNYYFRSKEKLFNEIMDESMKDLTTNLFSILNEDISFEEKIYKFVDKEIELLKANPDLIIFVFSELRNNAEVFLKKSPFKELANDFVIDKQLIDEAEKGNIRKISHPQFMSTLSGMTIFPFLSKPMIMHAGKFNEEDFNNFLDERKTIIPEMIISYLKNKGNT